MTNIDSRPGLALSAVQQAWLQEIGIDRRLLLQFMPRSDSAAATAPARQDPTGVGQAGRGAVQARGQAVAGGMDGSDAVPEVAEAPPARRPPVSLPVVGERAAETVTLQPAVALPAEWKTLEAHIAECQLCPLHAGRSQTVFGSGATEAVEWMLIGEAPGDRDDRMGLPFQGKAGELLQAMLAAAGVGPETPVFYTNVVKCRPRGNRTPKPEEIAACRPYLMRQIEMLKPRRILALGWLAAQSLLADESDLELLRGRVHWLDVAAAGRIPVVATYHPASLLSRAQHKANAWRDLNLARLM